MTLGASRTATQRDARPNSAGAAKNADSPSASEDAGSRPELVDASKYDIDRLERAVTGLVFQQRALIEEQEGLRDQLAGRDREIERLENELRLADERRREALTRVESLIGDLDRLDARLDEAMVDFEAPAGKAGRGDETESTASPAGGPGS